MFYLIKNETEIIKEAGSKSSLRRIYRNLAESEKINYKVSKFAPSSVKNKTRKKKRSNKKKRKSPFDKILEEPVLSKRERRRKAKRNKLLKRKVEYYDTVKERFVTF